MTSELFPRSAGILLHPTSLPGRSGTGDLGAGARAFVDFLRRAGMNLWQILPLVPAGAGESPYSSSSAMACNELLIDLDDLVEQGLLEADDARGPPSSPDVLDTGAMHGFKRGALGKAARRFADKPDHPLQAGRASFRENNPWVEDYALYVVLKRVHEEKPWWEWEGALRDRDADSLAAARADLAQQVDDVVTLQFFFERQWQALKRLCGENDIRIIGDMPLYVDADSADVWSHREAFLIDDKGRPEAVSGAPPDAFTALGQMWGSPIYDWAYLKDHGHAFWVERMRRALTQADIVRVDHFRGLSAYWSIPPDAPDARSGRWVEGPGRALFDDLEAALGELPLIAEDLGVIDDDVIALRESVGLPGMKVLQFAFDGIADNPYLPHNHSADSAVYPGTHDNNTTLGWWQEASERERDITRQYLGISGQSIAYEIVQAAYRSVADTCVVQMQDVLSLDGGSRMNTPGQAEGNWRWRVRVEAFNDDVAGQLRRLGVMYDRDVATRKQRLAERAAREAKERAKN
jgi:4-alpha-glucanotransferase